MRIDEPVDFQPYGARLAALLAATLLARSTLAADAANALGGVLVWGAALAFCWSRRVPLRARQHATMTVQWAGEAVAAIGMLVFIATLMSDGVIPALGALLLALTCAVLIVAERRAHMLLIVAACLCEVLIVAAASRSGWFAPCAAAFTLAVLSLFAFDAGVTLQRRAAATVVTRQTRSRGGTAAAGLVMLLAIPLYLYVPQPAALYLGGRSASSEHDYSDPRGSESTVPPSAPHSAPKPPTSAQAERESAADRPSAGRSSNSSSANPQHPAQEGYSVTDVQRDAALGNAIVMYVKTSQPVYLRGALYDRFEHDRWLRTGDAPALTVLRAGYLERSVPAGGTPITQQIDVVSDLHLTALPASAAARRIRFPGPQLYDFGDGTFGVPRPLLAQTSYAVDAAPELVGSRYAVHATQPDARYLQIDPELSARVGELARTVAGNAGGAWRQALAIETHLRSQYAYSYETIVPYQGRTPLDWFLFENRKGHCEFFASAMVVMLREIGIPARFATGFSLGERNPLTGYYEVRALDGHAWAEAWIDGRWIMFEPTPFYPMPESEAAPATQQVASAADRYLERQADTSALLDPAALRTAAMQALRATWEALRHMQRELVAFARRVLPWTPLFALLVACVVGAAVLCAHAAADLTERMAISRLLARAKDATGNAAPHLAQALERSLTARGVPRPAAQTYRAFLDDLARRGIDVPASLPDAFDGARYGSVGGSLAAQDVERLSAIVSDTLRMRPYPRVRARLGQWQNAIGAALSPLLGRKT